MMGAEQLDLYRRLTPSERWQMLAQLMDAAWSDLQRLPPQEQVHRWEYLRRSHEEGNQRLLLHLRKHGNATSTPSTPP